MRLYLHGRMTVQWKGRCIPFTVRPLRGAWKEMLHGSHEKGSVHLLLPYGCAIAPRDSLLLFEKPYLCRSVHAYPGHVRIVAERCMR